MPTTAPASPQPADGDEAVQASRLWFHRGAAPAMPRMHRHDDLEVNLVVSGRLEYLRGGEQLVVGAGRVALFWGATPHRLVPGAGSATDADSRTDACWLHVPLATALRWRLPEADLARLLSGEAVVLPHACAGPGPVERFETWVRELADAEAAPGAMLEVEALVRRLLLHARRAGAAAGPGADEGPEGPAPVAERDDDPVTALARFCVERFRDPVSTADAASAVGLSAPYATTLFRRRMGMTVGAYLIGCRVAEARRLLLTTSASAADVASASGFGSQSSFYEHFTRATGCTPAAYRRAVG